MARVARLAVTSFSPAVARLFAGVARWSRLTVTARALAKRLLELLDRTQQFFDREADRAGLAQCHRRGTRGRSAPGRRTCGCARSHAACRQESAILERFQSGNRLQTTLRASRVPRTGAEHRLGKTANHRRPSSDKLGALERRRRTIHDRNSKARLRRVLMMVRRYPGRTDESNVIF